MRRKFLENMVITIFILVLVKIVIQDIHWANLVGIGIFLTALNGIVSFLHPMKINKSQ